MKFSEIPKINLQGLNYAATQHARTLNRRIYLLGKFRAEAVAGNIAKNPLRPGEAVDEAMRREVMLRRDLVNFHKEHNLNHEHHTEGLKAAHKFLSDRGTHSGMRRKM